jgi:hypothetical protein
MPKYEIETSIDFISSAEFGDVELSQVIMEFKRMKKSFWESIDVGGSIVAEPLIYRERVLFGACDKNFYCLDMDVGKGGGSVLMV